MKKIAAFVMTVCLLLCLCLQLPAPPPREFKIVISIMDLNEERVIDMGEKYAYAVPRGALIKWTSDFDFLLQFEVETPFDENLDNEEITESVRSFEKTIKADAKINHLYKYTVFVVDSANKNKGLKLDPIIIIIPPRR
ncbi:MAG TPA: hypothetical protein VMZ49_04760 [Patescibacteria group bacterium]|nr:hypothetical protein [Patescibacteria group bacterium]